MDKNLQILLNSTFCKLLIDVKILRVEDSSKMAAQYKTKKARKAMYDIGAMKFSIPPRSPDFNPIENVFNFIKEELRKQAIEQNIVRENFENFSIRVKHTLENCPASYIDKTIESMPKRIMMVLKARGRRIKY